jgi:hypothetical protein
METSNDYNGKLNVIYEMIENSKTRIRENAFFYLLWGWLVLIASLSHFIMIKFDIFYSFLAWPVIMTAGMIISVIAGIRMGRRAGYHTYIDTAMIYLWYGFFFTLLVILSYSIAGKIPWEISNALIITMYGLGTFVSGGILKFKPLIVGGICCWIIALCAFFVQGEYTLLLVSFSIIISYLIPGYLLRKAH